MQIEEHDIQHIIQKGNRKCVKETTARSKSWKQPMATNDQYKKPYQDDTETR